MDDTTSIALAAIEKLDTCAVSDALDQLKLPPAITGITPRTPTRRIFGEVRTIRLGAALLPSTPPVHLGARTVASSNSQHVIFVHQDTGIDAAGWGGVLSNAAKMQGVRGVVIDGPARDIDECAEIGFPIFSRSTTARTARGRLSEYEIDGPLMVRGTPICSGDFLVIDSSGCAIIPRGEAASVIAAAARISDSEFGMTEEIRRGADVKSVMGIPYERMLSVEEGS